MTPTDPNTVAAPVPYQPPPSPLDEVPFEEVLAVHNRFHDELVAGRVDPDGKLANQHIAYYDGQVIDHDPDPVALYQRVAALPTRQRALVVLFYLERLDAIPG